MRAQPMAATPRPAETVRRPAATVSAPASSIPTVSDPEPVLVNAPGPVRELNDESKLLESKTPPVALTVALRLKLTLAVVPSAPPLKAMAVEARLEFPRFRGEETETIPAPRMV